MSRNIKGNMPQMSERSALNYIERERNVSYSLNERNKEILTRNYVIQGDASVPVERRAYFIM